MHAALFQGLSDFLSSSIILSRSRQDFSTTTFDAMRSSKWPLGRSEFSSLALCVSAFRDGMDEYAPSTRYHFFRQRNVYHDRRVVGGSCARTVAKQALPL